MTIMLRWLRIQRPWALFLSVALSVVCIFFFVPMVLAQSSTSSADLSAQQKAEVQRRIDELTQKLEQVRKEKTTLDSTIRLLDNKVLLNEQQIRKTQLDIQVTNSEVNDLSERVEGLKTTLSELSLALIHRVQEQYKQRSSDPMSRLFATTGAEDFFKQDKYLRQVRAHTQDLILATEEKRQDYDQQRVQKEALQQDLEALEQRLEQQQNELNQQKEDKRRLLAITQNDERTYQAQLAAAQAEAEGLILVRAGRGNETEVGKVNEGDVIASIIPGRSTCSTGTHLHFEVIKDGNYTNPFQWLSGDVGLINSSSDPVGGSGSWRWPVFNPARITQGYGMTSFARTGFYGGNPHTGIDLVSKTSSDLRVVAVKSGTLYRGGIRCGSGTMKYVKVKHDDDPSISTMYVHVNY